MAKSYRVAIVGATGAVGIEMLKTLENKAGREKVLEFLEKEAVKSLSFTEYPHEAEWILGMREKINAMIKENN